MFCFCREYTIKTWKEGTKVEFKVFRPPDSPIGIELIEKGRKKGHGTQIIAKDINPILIPLITIKEEISMRFCMDPNFEIYVADELITPEDIPDHNILPHALARP